MYTFGSEDIKKRANRKISVVECFENVCFCNVAPLFVLFIGLSLREDTLVSPQRENSLFAEKMLSLRGRTNSDVCLIWGSGVELLMIAWDC